MNTSIFDVNTLMNRLKRLNYVNAKLTLNIGKTSLPTNHTNISHDTLTEAQRGGYRSIQLCGVQERQPQP